MHRPRSSPIATSRTRPSRRRKSRPLCRAVAQCLNIGLSERLPRSYRSSDPRARSFHACHCREFNVASQSCRARPINRATGLLLRSRLDPSTHLLALVCLQGNYRGILVSFRREPRLGAPQPFATTEARVAASRIILEWSACYPYPTH